MSASAIAKSHRPWCSPRSNPAVTSPSWLTAAAFLVSSPRLTQAATEKLRVAATGPGARDASKPVSTSNETASSARLRNPQECEVDTNCRRVPVSVERPDVARHDLARHLRPGGIRRPEPPVDRPDHGHRSPPGRPGRHRGSASRGASSSSSRPQGAGSRAPRSRPASTRRTRPRAGRSSRPSRGNPPGTIRSPPRRACSMHSS